MPARGITKDLETKAQTVQAPGRAQGADANASSVHQEVRFDYERI